MTFGLEVPERPFNGGHLAIRAPRDVFSLTDEELAELKRRLDDLLAREKRALRPEGFNIYVEGDRVHVVPRWCGDVNVAFFGGLKVIPMSRDDFLALL